MLCLYDWSWEIETLSQAIIGHEAVGEDDQFKVMVVSYLCLATIDNKAIDLYS